MTKIIVFGDSFAADWTVLHSVVGWPNMLGQEYTVENYAQAGCSEYKIRQQLRSTDVKQHTHAIVAHTSKSRLPVEQHPLHQDNTLLQNCDFLYADIKEHNDPRTRCVVEYYENFYHTNFYEYVYDLIVKDIDHVLQQSGIPVLHITFFDHSLPVAHLNYHKLFTKHRGNANHLDKHGNQQVFKDVAAWIKNS